MFLLSARLTGTVHSLLALIYVPSLHLAWFTLVQKYENKFQVINIWAGVTLTLASFQAVAQKHSSCC